MFNALKQQWASMKDGNAGRRFEDRYEAAKKARPHARWSDRVLRFVHLLLALVLVAVGVVLVFIPGPAILFFFIGGGLLASESRGIARILDWNELKLRALWQWGRDHWEKLPGWGRLTVTLLATGLGAAGVYASYRLMSK